MLSSIGGFTDLKGGDRYANLVRKMEPKPLRVFQQDGSNDRTLYGEYAGYNSEFVVATEGHNGYGAAILPEALRWLWRKYPKPIAASVRIQVDRHFITRIPDPLLEFQFLLEGF